MDFSTYENVKGNIFRTVTESQILTFQVCNCGPLPLEEVGPFFYFWAASGGNNTDSTKRTEPARQWDQTRVWCYVNASHLSKKAASSHSREQTHAQRSIWFVFSCKRPATILFNLVVVVYLTEEEECLEVWTPCCGGVGSTAGDESESRDKKLRQLLVSSSLKVYLPPSSQSLRKEM